MSFSTLYFIFLLASPLPPSATPLPQFFYPGVRTWRAHLEVILTRLWGRAVRLRTHCTLCIYPYVHVCLQGVMWSTHPNAADYKQLAGPSLNQSDELLVVTSGWSRSMNAGFLYYALLILICGFQTIFGEIWNVLSNVSVCYSIFIKRVHCSWCPRQSCSALPNVSVVLSIERNPLCSCEGPVVLWKKSRRRHWSRNVGWYVCPPPRRPVTKMLND